MGGRLLAALAPLDDAAQLPPERDPEVERRADALGGQRQAVSGRVAGEEDAAPGRLAQLVGDPVALVADAVALQVLGEQLGRLADVELGVEGADADPQSSSPAGKRPAVAGRDVAAVDPDLQVLGGAGAGAPRARARAARRAAGSPAGRPAPGASRARRRRAGAETTPRSVSTAIASEPFWRAAREPLDLGGLEARVAVAPRAARRAAGSRRWRRSRGGGSASRRAGCGSRASRSAGARPPSDRAVPATRWGCRRRRSGARRSRSGRRSARRRPSRPARRATARPAKLAPQISTS